MMRTLELPFEAAVQAMRDGFEVQTISPTVHPQEGWFDVTFHATDPAQIVYADGGLISLRADRRWRVVVP